MRAPFRAQSAAPVVSIIDHPPVSRQCLNGTGHDALAEGEVRELEQITLLKVNKRKGAT